MFYIRTRVTPRQDEACARRPRRQERNYSLRDERLLKLAEAYRQDQQLPNPQHKGCYYFIIEALKKLGADAWHPFIALRVTVEKLMGKSRWNWFASRSRRGVRRPEIIDQETNVCARLHYNARTLQRVNDFGRKLLEVGQRIMCTQGCVIDIQCAGGWEYRLNTNSATPAYTPPPRKSLGTLRKDRPEARVE